ncbi:MAG: hypothetical protein PHN31_00060 [Candidatus Gracilibacteria bacterium]|nr:hypothetical protein [Candidatus Gracilibacteria bacterium]
MGEKLQHTEEHNDMPKKGLIFKFEEGTDNLKGVDRIENGKYIEGDKLPKNGQIYTFKKGTEKLTQIETIKDGKITETEILTGSQIDRIKLMVGEGSTPPSN